MILVDKNIKALVANGTLIISGYKEENVNGVSHQYLEGNAYLDCSQETSAIVDQEVKDILSRCHAEAVKLLQDNRALLDEIAEYLLLKETITGEELMRFVEAPAEETPAEETPAEENHPYGGRRHLRPCLPARKVH